MLMPAPYESEITHFLRDLKKKHPEIDTQQRQGRARLWDRTLDWDEQARYADSNVPQQPYVYQTRNP